MRTYQRFTLFGYLGDDPRPIVTKTGGAMCSLHVCTVDYTRRKPDGTYEDDVTWHEVLTFGRDARNAGDWLRKGSPVLIEGSIRYRQWVDREDRRRESHYVRAERVFFLPGGPRAASAQWHSFGPAEPQPATPSVDVPPDEDQTHVSPKAPSR